MKPMFRPISYFKDVAPFTFPGLDHFRTGAPATASWPTTGGAAGRTGRSAEPLVHDSFGVAWEVEVGDAARPNSLLVGSERIVVGGADRYGVWKRDGHQLGFIQRNLGVAWLDVRGKRLLVNDDPAVSVYTLDAQRESTLMLAAPGSGVTQEILEGPGALVLLTTETPPHGRHSAVLETTCIRDYGRTKNGTLYGIEPLAGIIREEDARVVVAAGPSGPVLATRDGVEWRDWQLRLLRGVETSGNPVALAADDRNQAYLLSSREGVAHLQTIGADGATLFDLALPSEDASIATLRIAASGQIYVTSQRSVLAVSTTGKILWRVARGAPATLSANGLLLLGGETLDALTPEGRSLTLWRPPAPILTPPVLADGRIYVATSERLYALQAAP